MSHGNLYQRVAKSFRCDKTRTFTNQKGTDTMKDCVPYLGNGLKIWHTAVSYKFFAPFVKIHCSEVAKTRPWVPPFYALQTMSVTSWARPVCVAKVLNTSRGIPFLFLIRRKRSSNSCKYWQNNRMKLACTCRLFYKYLPEICKYLPEICKYFHIFDVSWPAVASTLAVPL